MSLAQRFERRLESLVGSAFARVFKGQVEPVEIGAALQREAADKRNVFPGRGGDRAGGSVMCPNRYRVTLSPSDHERLLPWEAQLTVSLAELVQEHLDENGWTTIGDVEVLLALDESLHTGVFGVSSRMEPGAPPRSRPHDSLSIPIAADPDGGPVPPPAAGLPQPSPSTRGSGPPAVPEPEPERYAQPVAPAGGTARCPSTPTPRARPPPAPAAPAPRRSSSTAPHDRLDLRVGANLVGRGTEADLQLLDQGVSRRHVEIDFDGVNAICFDLGSTNGTTVNGHEIGQQAVTLQHGDVIRIGHTRLVSTRRTARELTARDPDHAVRVPGAALAVRLRDRARHPLRPARRRDQPASAPPRRGGARRAASTAPARPRPPAGPVDTWSSPRATSRAPG